MSAWPARLAAWMVRVYQMGLRPLLPPACRFEPSCSEYAHQAIETYGVMRGSAMAAWRLARCHPLGGHGHDPVPARAGCARHE